MASPYVTCGVITNHNAKRSMRTGYQTQIYGKIPPLPLHKYATPLLWVLLARKQPVEGEDISDIFKNESFLLPAKCIYSSVSYFVLIVVCYEIVPSTRKSVVENCIYLSLFASLNAILQKLPQENLPSHATPSRWYSTFENMTQVFHFSTQLPHQKNAVEVEDLFHLYYGYHRRRSS